MEIERKIEMDIAQKALNGDPQFAIAFALLQISHAQYETARALNRLGNGDASTHMGAIEGLGMQLEKLSSSVSEIASAIIENGSPS